uniref:Uncharacterized protein n=1 Tax=Timema shepardi TaxID=629360 RepID=A0A7R9G795_TIMSH|nr:unnamed protein product [Timema shepardi]
MRPLKQVCRPTNTDNMLWMSKDEFRGSIPAFARGNGKTIYEKHHLSKPNQDSNPGLPVISGPVCCESDALEHAVTEAGIYSSPVASLVLTDSSQLTSDSQHLGIYSSPVASLVLTDSSQLTSDSQHLGLYSSLMASLVLTDSLQITSDSQHLGTYSSPMASLVLTDS